MEYFASGGIDVAFMDSPAVGDATGVPVLLIHGFASNHVINWVNTLWVQTLTRAGRRVIALDNRGHGQSEKLYEPADYNTAHMARDAVNLLDHLGIGRAIVMGYSMGARIAAFVARDYAELVEALIIGGLGDRLLSPAGLPQGIAEALEAPSLADVRDPTGRMFRAFAEQTKSDLKALSACIRGSRQYLTQAQAEAIMCPVLVAVGSRDPIAGSGLALARHFRNSEFFEIPNRDHNQAVGDRLHRQAVVEFIGRL